MAIFTFLTFSVKAFSDGAFICDIFSCLHNVYYFPFFEEELKGKTEAEVTAANDRRVVAPVSYVTAPNGIVPAPTTIHTFRAR